MLNKYKVYSLTNILTNERYIGLTKQTLYDRFKNGKGYKPTTKINLAIEKYGWGNFKKEILFETPNKEKAEILERFYIDHFDAIDNGYNVQSGGTKGFKSTISDYHRQCISKANKGKHYSPQTEFKKGYRNPKFMTPIRCIETGIEYQCIADAEKELNISHHISDCLYGSRKTCGGYHWELLGGNE